MRTRRPLRWALAFWGQEEYGFAMIGRIFSTKALAGAVLALGFGSPPGLVLPASAAELLMYTRKGCAYCVLFERELGSIYPKTDEAKRAPLRRVHLDRPQASDPKLSPSVEVTPTFVLMQGETEVGRFSGYTNDLTFWSLLEVLMQRLPAAATPVHALSTGTQ